MHGDGSVYQRERDGRWCAQIDAGYRPNGTRYRPIRLARSKREAESLLRQMRRDLVEGRLSGDSDNRTTVKTWAAAYFDDQDRWRSSTYTTAKGYVDKWVVPAIGKRRLADLTPADVRAVTKAVTTAGRTPRTAFNVHRVMMKMLKAAKIDGHNVPERVLLVQPPTPNRSDRDRIPTPHVLALLKTADESGNPGVYARWVAALVNGMRQSEVLGLTWDCIDLDRGVIDVSWQLKELARVDKDDPAKGYRMPADLRVRHLYGCFHLTAPKTQAGNRVIPLVPWLHAALVAWRDQAPDNPWGLVWSHEDRGGVYARRGGIDRAEWYTLQDRAGVRHESGRHYTLHEARHTTATFLLELGVDSHVVTAIMGHSSILSTRAYQHVQVEQARKALDQVAARLGLAGPGPVATIQA